MYRGASVRKSLNEAFPTDIFDVVYHDEMAITDAAV
jgi:hypothetical protein